MFPQFTLPARVFPPLLPLLRCLCSTISTTRQGQGEAGSCAWVCPLQHHSTNRHGRGWRQEGEKEETDKVKWIDLGRGFESLKETVLLTKKTIKMRYASFKWMSAAQALVVEYAAVSEELPAPLWGLAYICDLVLHRHDVPAWPSLQKLLLSLHHWRLQTQTAALLSRWRNRLCEGRRAAALNLKLRTV